MAAFKPTSWLSSFETQYPSTLTRSIEQRLLAWIGNELEGDASNATLVAVEDSESEDAETGGLASLATIEYDLLIINCSLLKELPGPITHLDFRPSTR